MKKNPLSVLSAIFVLAVLGTPMVIAQTGPSRMYGKNSAFTVGELPAGKLKTGLLALSPSAREKAMNWLHTLSFGTFDAAEHMRVDQNGGIFTICPDCHGNCDGTSHQSEGTSQIPNPETSVLPPTAQVENSKASVPVTSPPAYNSKPGAPYHIYLDFNGAIVSGKAWSEGGVSSWDCAAWGTDTDATKFSDSEQADMRRVWERIAEDYAPFNINVTTDVTYDSDTYSGDKNKVGWLLFTATTDKNGKACPHNGAGGVAYVGVFGNANYFSTYQPAWVTPMSAANMAEAGSHEMGHNMGLSHDGTSSLEYYGGHVATASSPSWGPIMGTGYNRNVSQWSKGEYHDANQTQNDLSIISARAPYRTDDHGDSFANATIWSGGVVDQDGIVERTGNADCFEFVTGAGSVSFYAKTYRCDTATWGGNLDINLELYDEAGALVASSNPAAETNAVITKTVTAGTYYLMLKPSAAGDPTTNPPSGYKVYGSLGQYSITGNFVPTDGIVLTEPNGGELWAGGETRTITWVSGMGGNVKIELFKGGSLDSTVVASTANNGSYDWTIPGGQTPAADYRIHITSVESPDKSDASISDFTISPIALTEISVQQPAGTELVDGTSTVDFGSSLVGVPVTREFIIRNTGTADLTGLAINTAGTNAADFVLGALDVVTLLPGEQTTVAVVFTPSGSGVHNASLQITSNDSDENPFDVGLTGTGLAPDIAVEQPVGTGLTDNVSIVDYGNCNIGETVTLTFTIRNEGGANMSGLAMNKVGTNPGDFTLSKLPFPILAPGREMTFTAEFKPSTAGNRSATLSISSNDPDENPFTISLVGVGVIPVVPDIVVEELAGDELNDGDPMKGFGFVELGLSTTRTFTIRNAGIADMTGLATTLGGSHPGDFVCAAFAVTTLAPGEETTLTVTFTPTVSGTRYAKLQIASNDPNENPFDIELSGAGMILPYVEIVVEHPAGTDLVDGAATLSFGNTNIATPTAKTVILKNTGTEPLTGLAITASGTHAAEFALGALESTTLAPGAEATFTVTFTPTALGTRNAALHIANNDVDESPFDISLDGTGAVALEPEIVVEHPAGTSLVDGSASLVFGNSSIATPVTKTVTIRNTGTGNLTNLALTSAGLNASEFTLGTLGATTLLPGDETTFTVTFTPTATGTRIAALQIASDDANENPFDILLSGTGVIILPPEIAVEHPAGSGLTDGVSTLSFGNAYIDAPVVKTVIIRNVGTANLTGLAVSISGSHASDFAAVNPGAATLAPGASTTFTVTFSPTITGTRIADLNIVSNDANESPFNISLSGVGLAPPNPEIVVEHPQGTSLENGAALAFGTSSVGTPVAKTVTISNTGTASLTGLQLRIVGSNPSDFTLDRLLTTSLQQGVTISFKVIFNPKADGSRSAVLRIASNDADENPFDIELGGTGVIPPSEEITVRNSVGTDLVDGNAVLPFGELRSGSSVTKSITVINTGTANLINLSANISGTHASNFKVGALGSTNLAPGARTTVSIIFTASATGPRSALLQIGSSDANENPFDITLSGTSLPLLVPEIAIEQPLGTDLVNGKASLNFGGVQVGSESKVKVFTIINKGTAPLTKLNVTLAGTHVGDFKVIKKPAISVAPGKATQFKVIYKPKAVGLSRATLVIPSNDANENPFRIKITGKGL